MADVTRILEAIDAGDPRAASELLPLVYDELRKLAAAKLTQERPGQTLDATGLVHEAYIRLVRAGSVSDGISRPDADASGSVAFANRRHFFAAAAEAMRRILIDEARRKKTERHGGGRQRVDLQSDIAFIDAPNDELLGVHEALEQLAIEDPTTAELVKLHYFGGLKLEEAAELLGISARTAYRNWAFARAWLFRKLGDQ